MHKVIDRILQPHGVRHFGTCRYTDCLPLLPCRAAARIPAGARSVIVCLFPYYTGAYDRRNVARYAILPDYHRVAGDILARLADGLRASYPHAQPVWFVDNSPIREVRAAQLAGLGVVGRHGLLIHPLHGAHVFIGTVVTSLELPLSGQAEGACRECGRCLAACPTGALRADGPLEQARCRSFLTQKKGELSEWEQEQIRAGGLAWGCDRCTDACPMNTRTPSPIAEFYHNPAPLITLDALDPLLAQKAYGYRGRRVLERNLQYLTN